MLTKIEAIFSDYDGTLSPTSSARNVSSAVPRDLESVLWKISQIIPICIITSKDYHFLHPRTGFAWVVSCMMGIETLNLRNHNVILKEDNHGGNNRGNDSSCVNKNRNLAIKEDREILESNSVLLSGLAGDIEKELGTSIKVERKFTSDRQLLAGITVDYRHLEDWKICKHQIEPLLKEKVQKYTCLSSASSTSTTDLYCMTYKSHPFLDIYAMYCDKGIAFDGVFNEILKMRRGKELRGVLYLGDSENDNPAFRKASVALGVVSDRRLDPELDCQYLIEFKYLSALLEKLVKEDFRFSEDLLSRD
jgi:hydroxymethylpyrimidine pyrophosphatase-like HAD family hydrolase